MKPAIPLDKCSSLFMFCALKTLHLWIHLGMQGVNGREQELMNEIK